MDVIGPLPRNRGFAYVLTIIDRGTRMFAASPMRTVTAEETIICYLHHWIAVYGVPTELFCDRGTNFTSLAFKQLNQFLGTKLIFHKSYSPRSAGIIEKLNRSVKTALRCHENNASWVLNLSIVNLFLKNLLGDDRLSCAQVVFGQQLTLPAMVFEPDSGELTSEEARQMLTFVRECPPRPIRNHPVGQIQTLPGLETATHVFVKCEPPLTAFAKRYHGPYALIELRRKSATICKNGALYEVNREKLKPYFHLPINFLNEAEMLQNLGPVIHDNYQGQIFRDPPSLDENQIQNDEAMSDIPNGPNLVERVQANSNEDLNELINAVNHAPGPGISSTNPLNINLRGPLKSSSSSDASTDEEEEYVPTYRVTAGDSGQGTSGSRPKRVTKKPLRYDFEYNY